MNFYDLSKLYHKTNRRDFSYPQELELTSTIAEQTIQIRKSRKLKLPDAVIASTAIVHKLKLITRNTSDFEFVSRIIRGDSEDENRVSLCNGCKNLKPRPRKIQDTNENRV